ncbi:MAG: type II toxin-antitoxin system VapC family toxin [Alphaproteobacteria bacterium]|jgi:predicted nucleic acid-binding protein
MSFVLDSDIVMKWFFQEPDHEAAKQLLASDLALHAPDLIVSEIARVVARRLNAGTITQAHATQAVIALPAMFQALHSCGPLVEPALAWSYQLNLPIDNCFYLACAQQLGCSLVSNNVQFRHGPFRRATNSAGITVLSLNEAVARIRH